MNDRGERWPRRLAAALAALAALAAVVAVASTLTALPVGSASAQEPPAEVAADDAVLDLVGCLQGSHRLAVVFLIDESRSLQGTDPRDQRVPAAKAALSTLSLLTRGAESRRSAVDVSFAAFSNRYRTVRGWTRLRAESQDGLDDALSSYAARDVGTDTDFVNALGAARRSLAARSAALTAHGGASPCKAVLLFTDGQYDIGVRTAKDVDRLGRTKTYAPGVELTTEAGVVEAESVGRQALCDEGGLADGVRSDDITLLTVALTRGIPAVAQDLLRAITTGRSGAVTCGRPVDRPPGAYLVAEDVDLLIGQFDEVAARVAGATPVPVTAPVTLCGEVACAQGERTINLDPSVSRLRIFALAPRPGMTVLVTGPGGSTTVERPGDSAIGPVVVRTVDVAGRGWAIDLSRPSGSAGWTGPWKVAVVDPSAEQVGTPARLQAYVFSDFGIELGLVPAPTRGSPAKVTASLSVPGDVDVDDVLAAASAIARFEDPVTGRSTSIALSGPPAGPYTGTFAPPAGYRSNSYEVDLELRATTRDGSPIVARSAPATLLVRRPAGSIQIAPATLDLPTLSGSGSTSADLELTGGTADGCVWFGPAEASAPDAAGSVTVTYDGREVASEASCISVAAGATETIAVQVRPTRPATGAVRGVIEVHEHVAGRAATVTDVPYRLDLAVGIDEARRLVLAIVLLAAGLLLPLLVLLAINGATARFQSLDAVRGAVLPVRIQGQQLFRTDSARPLPLALRSTDFSSLSGTGSTRRFTFGGVQFRARASRNPFGATDALAAPEGGAERLKGRAGSRVELDPSLAGSWIFLLDPERTRRAPAGAAEGNLLAFLAEGEAEQQLDRMHADIAERLPETAAGLAGLVRAKPVRSPHETAAPAAPEGGPG